MKLWVKILIAMCLGLVTGWILGPYAEPLYIVGEIFLKLIGMIVVPLVLTSMTVGITNINDPKRLGKVGIKTLGFYAFCTILAVGFGVGFATLFSLGSGIDIPTDMAAVKTPEGFSWTSILMSLIPGNPFAMMSSNNNILQVIIFSLFLGLAITKAGKRAEPLLHWMESVSQVMYSLTAIIMEFTPIGVFAIMAWVAGRFHFAVLLSLAKFLLVYYGACLLMIFGVFSLMLIVCAKLHPRPFFKGMWEAITVAFATCSSSATLPTSLRCIQENLGVSKNLASFVLPLGASVNMAGAAIFQGMSAIFIAHAYDISLEPLTVFKIVFTAVLAAVGAAGIPGSGILMLYTVLSSAGLPLEGVGLLFGIDRLREMISTVANLLGDAVVTVIVAKQEGELDLEQYARAEYSKPVSLETVAIES